MLAICFGHRSVLRGTEGKEGLCVQVQQKGPQAARAACQAGGEACPCVSGT